MNEQKFLKTVCDDERVTISAGNLKNLIKCRNRLRDIDHTQHHVVGDLFSTMPFKTAKYMSGELFRKQINTCSGDVLVNAKELKLVLDNKSYLEDRVYKLEEQVKLLKSQNKELYELSLRNKQEINMFNGITKVSSIHA